MSAKGELLAGVSITISGSTEGASSDSSGVYRIALPKKKNLLVFSAIGFQKKQTWIDSPGQLDVILSPQFPGVIRSRSHQRPGHQH
ncbi:MAG: carboxypeptidase-like regulatory domain-containing protein [Sphingobacteriales bacterium]|nr:carboxypeptidase-like regulatory domain-containing protein [Sphingobacteriales bacterium]